MKSSQYICDSTRKKLYRLYKKIFHHRLLGRIESSGANGNILKFKENFRNWAKVTHVITITIQKKF